MVSQNLRAQATVLLPAPYLEEGGFFDVPPRIRISAKEFQLCLYVSMVPPAFTLLYMGNFKKLQVQKILAVADTEVFGKLLHLVIPDGVDSGQVCSKHKQHNSLCNHNYNAFFYENCEWFYHFHKNFELIYILSGEVELTLNGRKYLLDSDTFALILPNEFHAYHTPDHSLAWVGVLSSDYVSEFAMLTQNKRASTPVFSCEPHIRDFLLRYLITDQTLFMFADNSFLVMCLHHMLKLSFEGMFLPFAPVEADLEI